MEAPLLRWLYARRKPNQSFKIAFDQEIQRLYDEWDSLGRKVADGTVLPADAAAYSRAVRTAAGELPSTPRPPAVPDARLGRRHHRRRRGPDAAHPQ
ncbi:lysyl-tRNA synthetase, class 1 [Streptomyces sp. Ncost-T6T-2b]|nr:lysyl-tRNA synthetase, class 1 [Streptomyces sp. Ncost-T6T-2b]